MNECFGKKFILNGELHLTDSFDNALVYEGESVYEVLRLIKGNPIFFHDHMERLSKSASLRNKKLLADAASIRKSILDLTRSEKKKEANLKIVFNYNNGSENFLVYYVEPVYPSKQQYLNGVKGILFHAERNLPESKVINKKLKSAIANRLLHEGAYEAILVNGNDLITEGSRSNIFFVRNNLLYTAPDEFILSGITRKHILKICEENNITVRFCCVNVAEINDFEAAFMTGTSPMVLPFCCINEKRYDLNVPLIGKLRELYMKKAEESIRLFVPEY